MQGHLRSLPRLDPVPSSSISEMDEISKGGALTGHSGAVLRYHSESESFHNHTAKDIRAGTGDKEWQFLVSGTGF